MLRFPAFGTVVLITALRLCAQEQSAPTKELPAGEAKGIPPRATPADYQAHAPAGTVTVAAEFIGHSVPTQDGSTYTTEDYVAVETGLYGPSGARLKISVEDFTLRVLAKKTTSLPSQPFGAVFRSLKDPVWEDSVAVEAKSKSSTSINTGGKGGEKEPAAPVHMPLELQRAMQQRVQKTALPEGDRALPQAGLIFFPYRGKVDKIRSIELVYAGPAGTATLALQP
ncbi:MAG TPA: hypothetical protein VMQ86_08190 [Bryobacteraceae bacterium]|jgi:hypothetical protein|nr:hypothetical protein [Bryobacteraceae bacterium]